MTVVLLAILGGVATLIGLVVVAAIGAARKERGRMAALTASAAAQGWRLCRPPMPRPVDTAWRSARHRIALARRLYERDVWMVWHRWQENSGDNTTTTKDLTRYYLWLGPSYPDVKVQPRTSIGAFFRPVRGIGTGDPEFDRRFLVQPSGHPAPLAVVNPVIRQAMLHGALAPWQIDSGTLILAYADRPTPENLQPRADAIIALARLLA